MDTALHAAGTETVWFPETRENCEQNLGLNKHMGAEGAMSPGRVQDLEGAKTITIGYNSPAGAIVAIVKRRFLITCYTQQDTYRLRLDQVLTAGITAEARTSAKRILIHDAHIQPPVRPGPHPLRTGHRTQRKKHMGGQHPKSHGAVQCRHHTGPRRTIRARGHGHQRKTRRGR